MESSPKLTSRVTATKEGYAAAIRRVVESAVRIGVEIDEREA